MFNRITNENEINVGDIIKCEKRYAKYTQLSQHEYFKITSKIDTYIYIEFINSKKLDLYITQNMFKRYIVYKLINNSFCNSLDKL